MGAELWEDAGRQHLSRPSRAGSGVGSSLFVVANERKIRYHAASMIEEPRYDEADVEIRAHPTTFAINHGDSRAELGGAHECPRVLRARRAEANFPAPGIFLLVARWPSSFRSKIVSLPPQGRDGERRALARANPPGRGQLERTHRRICLAAVSYDQRNILIDRRGAVSSKIFLRTLAQFSAIQGDPLPAPLPVSLHRRAVRVLRLEPDK
jgi:hypothetical protein